MALKYDFSTAILVKHINKTEAAVWQPVDMLSNRDKVHVGWEETRLSIYPIRGVALLFWSCLSFTIQPLTISLWDQKTCLKSHQISDWQQLSHLTWTAMHDRRPCNIISKGWWALPLSSSSCLALRSSQMELFRNISLLACLVLIYSAGSIRLWCFISVGLAGCGSQFNLY